MNIRTSGLAALLSLAACQHYAPAPLPLTASLAPSIAAPASRDARQPLTVTDVVRLALSNDPDLRAYRAKRGVARAQLLESGILPNPSLSGALMPLLSGIGVVPAWNVGLNQDVRAIITYRSRQRAARDTVGQVDADILWQEWQVAGQARQLATDLIGTRRQQPIVDEAYRVLSLRNTAMQSALAAGNTTLVLTAPTLSALQAARTSRNAVNQRELQLRHQLTALLGLDPEAEIQLTPGLAVPPLDAKAMHEAIASLPERRPDLVALRLGYAAQEEATRQAILSQFPDLVFGADASSDSSKVINLGPAATLGLPVFDRGQGNIAIARATRAQLQAEYAARLATTKGEVEAALSEMNQLSCQLSVERADLPAARLAATRAQEARGRSAIDEASYVSLIASRFIKEQDVMALELALEDRLIMAQTLLGIGLPSVGTLPEAAR